MEFILIVKIIYKIDLFCGYDLNIFLIKKFDLYNVNDYFLINGI